MPTSIFIAQLNLIAYHFFLQQFLEELRDKISGKF